MIVDHFHQNTEDVISNVITPKTNLLCYSTKLNLTKILKNKNSSVCFNRGDLSPVNQHIHISIPSLKYWYERYINSSMKVNVYFKNFQHFVNFYTTSIQIWTIQI